jgi:hypothetical protein
VLSLLLIKKPICKARAVHPIRISKPEFISFNPRHLLDALVVSLQLILRGSKEDGALVVWEAAVPPMSDGLIAPCFRGQIPIRIEDGAHSHHHFVRDFAICDYSLRHCANDFSVEAQHAYALCTLRLPGQLLFQ